MSDPRPDTEIIIQQLSRIIQLLEEIKSAQPKPGLALLDLL